MASITDAAAQGYPVKNQTEVEMVKKLQAQARKSLIQFAKLTIPWYRWDKEEKELREEELRGSVPALIDAWYAYFEPENLAEYRSRQEEAEGG